MILCPSCRTQNRPGAKFCRGCGQALPLSPAGAYRQPAVSLPGQSAARPKYLWPLLGAGLLLALLLLVAGSALLWYGFLTSIPPTNTPSAVIVTDGPTSTVTTETSNSGVTIPPTETPPAVAVDSPTPTPTSGPLIIPGTDIEIPHLSDEDEIEIGREVAAEIEAEYGVYQNSAKKKRIANIGQQIVPHCDRPHLTYHFTILDTDEINAFAAPGGFIYVSRGMLEFIQSDDELAAVIGHEIAHVAQRHSAETIEAIVLTQMAAEALLAEQPDLADIYETEIGQISTQMAALLLFNGWSQQQEFEADKYGTIYMARAGYRPRAVIDMFRRMQARFEPEDPGMAEQLLLTHPPFENRIEWVEETIETHGLQE